MSGAPVFPEESHDRIIKSLQKEFARDWRKWLTAIQVHMQSSAARFPVVEPFACFCAGIAGNASEKNVREATQGA